MASKRAIVVVGAGSVGLCAAARLQRAGHRVLLVCRTQAQADAIREHQLTATEDGETWRVPVEATADLHAAATTDAPLLLATRLGDTKALGAALAGAGRSWQGRDECDRNGDGQLRNLVVSLSNGVNNERDLAEHLPNVAGGVWRLRCQRVGPAAVRWRYPGRVILGRWRAPGMPPQPAQDDDSALHALGAQLQDAGFDVAQSPDLRGDRWLKLLLNLGSGLSALVRRDEQGSPRYAALYRDLLAEAVTALDATGTPYTSCDGSDLGPEALVGRVLAQRAVATSLIPNSVHAALATGAELEPLTYHREVLALAARAGTPAPTHARWLVVLEQVRARGIGPGTLSLIDALR